MIAPSNGNGWRESLWPDMDQSQAFANLRPVLSELRGRWADQRERLQSPTVTPSASISRTRSGCPPLRCRDNEGNTGRSGAGRGALSAAPCWKAAARSGYFRNAPCASKTACRRCRDWQMRLWPPATMKRQSAIISGRSDLDPWSEAARRGWMEALAKSGTPMPPCRSTGILPNSSRSEPNAVPDEATSALYQRLRDEARQRASAHPRRRSDTAKPSR